MKSFVLALMAAVALTVGGAPEAAEAAAAKSGYAKRTTTSGYWYRGRWYPTYRRASSWRVSAAARAAANKKFQLPEYAPKYSASGNYIPTQYIYQKTNGEFRILTPTPPPAAKGKAATPGGADELRRALQGINGQGNGGAKPPAPPQPPTNNQPAGRTGMSGQ